MSFVGSYTHSMDAKKRVFIPSKYRDDLGEERRAHEDFQKA